MRIELIDKNFLEGLERAKIINYGYVNAEVNEIIYLIAKSIKSYEDEQEARKVATAANISHNETDLHELYRSRTDYEKNINLISKIVRSGHDSVAEHQIFTFFVTDVSPIIEYAIIKHRLISPTVKSRRYVDMRAAGFYTPDFSYLNNGKKIKEIYEEHMKSLFDTYVMMEKQEIPIEDARFILPYCFKAQIAFTLNARELITLIAHCLTSKESQIPEVKKFGLKLLKIAQEKSQYYKDKYAMLEKQAKEKYEDKLSVLDKYCDTGYTLIDQPKIISVRTDYDGKYPLSKVDRTIIVRAIMQKYQKSFEKANAIFDKLSDAEKKQAMYDICMSDDKNDVHISDYKRPTEHVSFGYELSMSLAGATHLIRHRMQGLLIPHFLPVYDLKNQIVPKTIEEKCLDVYLEAVNRNIEIYEQLRQMGVEEKDLVYFNLSGTKINMSTTMNGRELMHFTRLRKCNRAQWEIQAVAKSIISQVESLAPLYSEYLGAPCEILGKCKESHPCGHPYTYRRRDK